MKTLAKIRAAWLLMTLGLVIAACSGGGSQSTETPSPAPPTKTPFPTFEFVEPTKAQVFEQTQETPDAPGDVPTDAGGELISLDPKKVDRGRGRYEALECGSCHGVNGEGSDQAESLLNFSLSEEDFITFVRSGGELGTDHQYSTDRLSNSGSRNLYLYLVSVARAG